MKPPNIFERLEQSKKAKLSEPICEHSDEFWCSKCVWPGFVKNADTLN